MLLDQILQVECLQHMFTSVAPVRNMPKMLGSNHPTLYLLLVVPLEGLPLMLFGFTPKHPMGTSIFLHQFVILVNALRPFPLVDTDFVASAMLEYFSHTGLPEQITKAQYLWAN